MEPGCRDIYRKGSSVKWNDVIPVVVSVLVIILVAVLEKQSKLVAAVTATMPLGIPLALWIVYSSSRGEPALVESFTRSMAIGILPTVTFAVAIWLAARAGLKLMPILGVGYLAWAASLGVLLGVQRLLALSRR
jgi:hypothetical protein